MGLPCVTTAGGERKFARDSERVDLTRTALSLVVNSQFNYVLYAKSRPQTYIRHGLWHYDPEKIHRRIYIATWGSRPGQTLS